MDRAGTGGAESLSTLLQVERDRLLDGVEGERLDQMHAAEEQGRVYAAWNAVCDGTREGDHVTGLCYLARENKLLVYMDSPSWTQEMTMLREIIRARMERAGAKVDGLIFKTSAAGYRSAGERRGDAARTAHDRAASSPAPVPLSEEERGEVDSLTDGIGDEHLRRALKKAMVASLEWSKSKEIANAS